jgi:serine/threonine protein kinase
MPTPFPEDLTGCDICIPLQSSFRFAHEPTRPGNGTRFRGRQDELRDLTLRILFSDGGAFLITGYRGVGKTSFVNEVLFRLSDALDWAAPQIGPHRLVAVTLSLAKRTEPNELMHYVVRQLYNHLDDLGILKLLPSSARRDLARAYKRTSFAMSTKSSNGLDLSIKNPTPWPLSKLPFEMKWTKSISDEASYLGYDEKSAEHDIIRLSRELTKGYTRHGSFADRLRRALQRQPAPKTKLKVIFVFDELDKLEADGVSGESTKSRDQDPDGPTALRSSLDSILTTLKTLFTTSGITFIFVAGKDLYDRWTEDVGKGDSVYESVFSYDKYLPCVWNDVQTLCGPLTDTEPLSKSPCSSCLEQRKEKRHFCLSCGRYLGSLRAAKEANDSFIKYLSFRGRGIPRRIFRAFNKAVRWTGHRPILAFTAEERKIHETYAELWDLLSLYGAKILPRLFDDSTDSKLDSRRLATFYSIDWMLTRGREAFTISDVLSWAASLSPKIMPRGLMTDQFFLDIIRLLIKGDFIEEVREGEGHAQRIIAGTLDVRAEALGKDAGKQYRVASRRLADLGIGEALLDEEAAILNPNPKQDRCGDYQLESAIGSGGMGRVYRATQISTGRRVAVKLLRVDLDSEQEIRLRFQREIAVMRDLQHPNIVRFLDSGEDNGRIFIAMEYIDGLELQSIVAKRGALDARIACTIATDVADGLRYIHERNFIRNDVKPSNIMVSSLGRVFLIDFGLSRNQLATILTRAGAIVGTPGFMAPEQFRGERIDQRSDQFSFGVVLYQMLTGRRPFDGTSPAEQMRATLDLSPASPSSIADVPQPLAAIAMRCLEKQPQDRFPDMLAVSEALVAFNLGRANLAEFMRETLVISRARLEREAEATILPNDHASTTVTLADEKTIKLAPRQFPAGQTTRRIGEIPIHSTFRIVKGPATVGVILNFDAPRIRIGRISDNDIVLEGTGVSRFHAEVIVNASGHWIQDLGSRAGTRVDGVQVSSQQQLPPHCSIGIGEFELEFTAGQG